MDSKAHWEHVYDTKPPSRVSWFQEKPSVSLELIAATGVGPEGAILDVGGGASRLIDNLLDAEYAAVGVVDIAAAALRESQQRLGEAAGQVEWFVADITSFASPHRWDVWHDRAVFHFLTESADRAAYRKTLFDTLAPTGDVIVAAFSLRGPPRCSGLDVMRYSPESLLAELGPGLELVETRQEAHCTPAGAVQDFLYCRIRRLQTSD